MSRGLKWDQVQLPQFSTRDLSLAGAQITNSFDRMGQMLMDREARLRTEATDEASMGILSADTAEGAKAALAAAMGSGNKRINGRALAQLASTQQDTLMERGLNQEKLLEAQDPAKFATQYAQLQAAAKQAELTGDQAPVQELIASMGGARSIAQFLERGTQLGNEDQTQAMTLGRDRVDAEYKRGSLANDRERIAISRKAAAAESVKNDYLIKALQRGEAERVETERATDWARTYGNSMGSAVSGEDLPIYLRQTERYKNASSAARTAMELEAQAAYDSKYTPTSSEQEANSGLSSQLAVASSAANIGKAAMTAAQTSKTPALGVLRRVEQMEADGIDPTDATLQEAYKDSGIPLASSDLRNLRDRFGLSNRELMAMKDEFGFNQRGYFESMAKLGVRSFIPGAVAREKVLGATDDLYARAQQYVTATRTNGEAVRSQEVLAGATGSLDKIQAQLTRAVEKAERERIEKGEPNVATEVRIRQLKEQLMAESLPKVE